MFSQIRLSCCSLFALTLSARSLCRYRPSPRSPTTSARLPLIAPHAPHPKWFISKDTCQPSAYSVTLQGNLSLCVLSISASEIPFERNTTRIISKHKISSFWLVLGGWIGNGDMQMQWDERWNVKNLQLKWVQRNLMQHTVISLKLCGFHSQMDATFCFLEAFVVSRQCVFLWQHYDLVTCGSYWISFGWTEMKFGNFRGASFWSFSSTAIINFTSKLNVLRGRHSVPFVMFAEWRTPTDFSLSPPY